MKRVIAFGLLAASLIVAPTAAFADTQSQTSDQFNEQNGAATDGSFNEQNAENVSNQRQAIDGKNRRRGYRKPARKYRGRRAKQEQDNVQGNVQSGAADYESENRQDASNRNNQRQRNRR
ncbi:hypothetical protein [Mastigocoleus testarum]|uniref:Uncharacterized protein n=1 Tax=Mastigocoleus testarum BC008 TaxID=371196 RepID=A0A0V7ZW88_9CYAN|nr:hypothetical protein [Mastigocoleus testarum]KST68486.1 hypothetical protein BC008_01050 [Mastigocoleus testarum BC008]